jgi:hypothetical protein
MTTTKKPALKLTPVAVPVNWQELEHHEYAGRTEFGQGIDLAAMAAHMKEYGYDTSEPIVLFDGKQILDGRHKHQAAIMAGVTPSFAMFQGDNPMAYVYKKALRQHLTKSQLGMLGADMATLDKGEHPVKLKEFNRDGQICLSATTLKEASQALNVSEGTIKKARKVKELGTEALQQAVRDGTVAVSDAAAVANEPPEVQEQAVADVREKKAKTARESAKAQAESNGHAEKPAVDREKHILPEALRSIFEDGKGFDEAISHLREVEKIIDRVARTPGGEMLGRRVQAVGTEDKVKYKLDLVQKTISELKATRPHAACVECMGSRKPLCKGCSGRGWIAHMAWHQAKPEEKEQVAQALGVAS